MATQHAEIRLQLAYARLRALAKPSWPTVAGAIIAAALLMWWVMARQAPAIDPQSVIAANLAAAHHAVRQARFVEPFDRSALRHFSAVLALDPANAEARAGLDRVADHFVERTKTAIVDGRIAEAALTLETLRRVQPDHRRIGLLDAQLRRALEERAMLHASSLRTPDSAPPRSIAAKPSQLAAQRAVGSRPETVNGPIADESIEDESNANMQASPALLQTAEVIPALTADESAPPASVLDESQQAALSQSVIEESQPAAASISEPAPVRERTLIAYVAPEYPREAMLRGIEGWIDVQMQVTPAGDVIEPSVQAGKARQLFERSALAAVRRWKYDARPESSAPESLNVRVSFQLED